MWQAPVHSLTACARHPYHKRFPQNPMELSPKQQVTELIRKFNRILVVTHARPDGDALGSLLAVQTVLDRLGKDVTAVMRDDIPEMLQFLPGLDRVAKDVAGGRDLVVSVDTSKTPVDKLKYNTRDGKLNVIISPKEGGHYEESDVSVTSGSFNFDLIIVLDYPDLFYETPVVNIDHHPSNDYFGAVNLVDLTATSTSEILVGVIEALGESLLDEDVATQLLTGLITDTGSFQNANTTPKSLTVSAQLVAAGGRQQEIVQHVYRTKPLSTLRLWGRALSRLKSDETAKMVWSSVSKQDFEETGGTTSDAKNVIDALMSSAPDAEIILLLREGDGKVDGSVRTTKGVDATQVVGFWNGGGHKGAAGFEFKGTLEEAEQGVVNQIRNWQLERMGIDEQVERKSGGASVGKSARAPRPAPSKPAPRPQSSRGQQPRRPQNPPAPRNNPRPQEPLTDDQLDAYFKKTSGGKGQVIDQKDPPNG